MRLKRTQYLLQHLLLVTLTGCSLFGQDAGSAEADNRVTNASLNSFGKILVVANAGSDSLSAVLLREKDAGLVALPGSPYPTGRRPVDVATRGEFVAVLNQQDATIRVLRRVDADNNGGSVLKPVGADVSTGGSNPTQITFVENSDILLVVNQGSSSLGIFRIDQSGQLTRLSTPAVLAAGAYDVLCRKIQGPDDNAFVYISAQSSIQAFRLNTRDASLTALPGSPFSTGGNGARQMSFFGYRLVDNEDGLAVANFDSDTVSLFSINYETGAITRQAILPTGDGPSGVFQSASANFGTLKVLNRLDGTYTVIHSSQGNLSADPPLSMGRRPTAGVPVSFGTDVVVQDVSNILEVRQNDPSTVGSQLLNSIAVGVDPESVAKLVIPSSLGFQTQPGDVQANSPIAPPIVVRIITPKGEIDDSQSGPVTLSLLKNPGGATLVGTTTVNAVKGLATFDNVAITAPGTGYSLFASYAGSAPVGSQAFNVAPVPGAPIASSLQVTIQPVTAVQGATLTPALQVSILDQNGRPLTTDAGRAISLSIGTQADPANPGILSGTLTQNTVNGVATFPDLSIDRPGSGYRLLAQSPGLNQNFSSSFNINARPVVPVATALQFSIQPANATQGATLSPAVEVLVFDQNGSLLNGDNGRAVSLSIGVQADPANPATLSGTLNQNTVNGVASFNNLSLNRPGNGYRLTALSAGLTAISSNPFDIVASLLEIISDVGNNRLAQRLIGNDGNLNVVSSTDLVTSNRPETVLRVGNFVYTGVGGTGLGSSRIQGFPVSGANTTVASFSMVTPAVAENQDGGEFFNFFGLTANLTGNRLIVTDSIKNQVRLLRIESNGALTPLNPSNGSTVGAAPLQLANVSGDDRPRYLTYLDVPASPIDLIVISKVNSGHLVVLRYDSTTDVLTEIAGSPFAVPAPAVGVRRPEQLAVSSNHLYVASPANGDLMRFDLNFASGAPTFVSATPMVSPQALRVEGSTLYVTDLPDQVQPFSIQPDGSLTAGGAAATGQVNPKGLDVVTVGGTKYLYVATSSQVQRFLLNADGSLGAKTTAVTLSSPQGLSH